jgi:hypothetical protein
VDSHARFGVESDHRISDCANREDYRASCALLNAIVRIAPQVDRLLAFRSVRNAGSNACVARAAMEGHPGLERSMDCVAQWSHATSGICHDGKSPAFCAMQDSKSAGRFARSLQGSNACVRRVTQDGHPGLTRSMEAQRNGLFGDAPHPSLLLGAALRAFVAVARHRHGVPENK